MTTGSNPPLKQQDGLQELGAPETTSISMTWRIASGVARAAFYPLGLLALLVVTFVALGVPPVDAIHKLWSGAFGDAQTGRLYALSETALDTAPLLMTALAVIVAWRAGLFSIGAEGQLLIGALAATIVGLHIGALPGPVASFTLLIVGALAGAGWAWIAGYMRVRRNVQEVISTIMLNYVAIYLVRFMVEGPLQERSHVNPESDAMPAAAMFARVIPRVWSNDIVTRFHTGVLLSIVAVPVVWLLLFRTRFGFALRLVGQNPEAARTAGFNVDRVRLTAMAISGGLCGLAGVVELLGVTGRLYANFSPGWGFTAIPVALLGSLHPVGALISAVFFGALTAGSGNLNRFSGVSSVVATVIQACAVLAVVGASAWQARRDGAAEAE